MGPTAREYAHLPRLASPGGRGVRPLPASGVPADGRAGRAPGLLDICDRADPTPLAALGRVVVELGPAARRLGLTLSELFAALDTLARHGLLVLDCDREGFAPAATRDGGRGVVMACRIAAPNGCSS